MIIDSLLRNGLYSTKELLDKVNAKLDIIDGLKKDKKGNEREPITSLNTIRADLRHIEYNYPQVTIIKVTDEGDMRHKRFGYASSEMSIHKLPFNDEEMSQLQQCMAILSRFDGLPNMKWMNDFIERFKCSLNIDSNLGYVVGFDTCEYLKGQQHFNRLLTAITHHQVLKIQYQSFKRTEPKEMIVYPYFVKEFNKRWFLLCRSKGFSNISSLAFDRIVSIDIAAGEPFVTEDEIDFQREYFDDMIGVTRSEAPLEKIKLWVSKETAPYIATKPLHGSQKPPKWNDDGSMIIEIEVIPNYELEQALLYYGEGVKVLSPQSMVDKMKAHAERMAEAYNSDKD